MSNMKKIAETLQDKSLGDEGRWVQVKTGWLNFSDESIKNKNILDIITNCDLEIHPNRKLASLRKNRDITTERQVYTSKNKESEVYWERKIVDCNDKIYNQLCVGKGNTEAIDLIYSNDSEEINKIIEFKTTSNTPLYAFIEVIKNYCLLQKLNQGATTKIDELILLAPKSYYKKFKNPKPIEEFFKTISRFNNNNEIKFEIKYIDFDSNTLEDINNIPKELLVYENWKSLDNENWLDL